MLEVKKETTHTLVAIVCIFWILFNVVAPIVGSILDNPITGNHRGWRGTSINYHPDIDTYISEFHEISGRYSGYIERTSVGREEYWITVGSETVMCVYMKQCFLDTLNYCLGENITLMLEQYGQYSKFSSDKSWVVIGVEINQR